MNKYSGSLVTAIIPTHNRASLLPKAIKSVINQTYNNIEIIIVDDGSKDNTGEVVDSFIRKNQNIKYLKHEFAKGACAARNYGVKEAKGEFVAGLDDDDEWLPDRIEKMLEVFDDKYAFVYSNSIKKDGKREYIEERQPVMTFDKLLQGGNRVGTQILTKKQYILDVGGSDECLPSSQDYDLCLRLLERRDCAIGVEIPLMIRNTSHEHERISASPWKHFRGKFIVYCKNKNRMTRKTRKKKLYHIHKILHPQPSFYTILRVAPKNKVLKELSRFISHHLRNTPARNKADV